MLNVGGGYDSSTSTFTAPVAGVYKFYTLVRTTNNANAPCPIFYLNGATTHIGGYGFTGSGVSYMSASATALLQLAAGDAVFVSTWLSSVGVGGMAQNIYYTTTFEGFLIAAAQSTM